MYRRLIVMRHAKSSWKDPHLEDHDRPLNKRGLRDAPRISEELYSRGWIPDLILVSSSRRTMQTLEMMKNRFGDLPSEVRPGIYHASVYDLIRELEDTTQKGTTMILGHNPGSEILINRLSGNWIRLPTASAALLVENESNWDLEDVIRPKELHS